MIRPSKLGVILFSFSVPISLLVVSKWPHLWFIAFYYPFIFFALSMVDLLSLLSTVKISTEIKIPEFVYLGNNAIILVNISWPGKWFPPKVEGILSFSVESQTSEIENPEIFSAEVFDSVADLSFVVVPLRRGKICLDICWLRWKSQLGLLSLQKKVYLDSTINVSPNIGSIFSDSMLYFCSTNNGSKSVRIKGEGTEFESLCDYATGMDIRFIDWKHSARHRKLLCQEFRQEKNSQIVIGFDTGHLMTEPINNIPKLDHAIRAGLLLGWISLNNGDTVGCCYFDNIFRNFIKPSGGLSHFRDLIRFTSDIDYQPEETNFTLGLMELNSKLKRRTLVILFSEFIDQISADLLLESLHIISRKHLVVFISLKDETLINTRAVKPSSFEKISQAVIADDFIVDREIILEKISRMGIQCIDTYANEASISLVDKYLMIKNRGLL